MAGHSAIFCCVLIAISLSSFDYSYGFPVTKENKDVKPVPAPAVIKTDAKSKLIPQAPKSGDASKKETIDVATDLKDMDKELPTQGEGDKPKLEHEKEEIKDDKKTAPSDEEKLEVADIRPISKPSNALPTNEKHIQESQDSENDEDNSEDDVGIVDTNMGEDAYGADTDEDVDPDEDVSDTQDSVNDVDAENMEKAGQIADEAINMEKEAPAPTDEKPLQADKKASNALQENKKPETKLAVPQTKAP